MCVQNEGPPFIFSYPKSKSNPSIYLRPAIDDGRYGLCEGTRGLSICPGTNSIADNCPDKMGNYGLNLKIFN